MSAATTTISTRSIPTARSSGRIIRAVPSTPRLPQLSGTEPSTQAPTLSISSGNSTGTVFAFTPSGAVKWTFVLPVPADPTLDSYVDCSPALGSASAPDDTLYVKGDDNNLYALNTANGSVKWTYTVPRN